MLTESKEKGADQQTKIKIELDFQHIQSRVICFDMQVEFNFTDDTLLSLEKTLASFPTRLNEKEMPIIRFGHTINQVSLQTLEGLLRVCQGKVIVDLAGTDLKAIFKRSKHANLIEHKNAEQLSEDDNYFLFDLQKSKLYQLLRFVLNENDENLKALTSIPDPDNPTQKITVNFINICLRNRDAQLLELLLSLDSEVLNSQLREVKNRNSMTLRLINTIDFDIWVQLSSNTAIFNPHQESLIFQALIEMQTANPAMFRRSMKWWHARFGPSMPQEIINDVMRYSSCHDFMKAYRKMYPNSIYFRKGMDYVEVECTTAYKFAAIRKLLVKAWEIGSSGPSIDSAESEGTYHRPLDVSELEIPLSDFKLLNMILSDKDHSSIKNLTAEKVNELDKWADKLMLDTHKYLYIGRTRLGDNTGHQIETIFYGKNVRCEETEEKYEIEAGFNKDFDA